MKKIITAWSLFVCLFAAWQFSGTDMPRFKNPPMSPAHAQFNGCPPGLCNPPASASGGSLTWTTLGSGNTASATGTPTLPATASVNIGTAASDRIVVVCFGNVGATSAKSNLSSVTLSGVSATKAAASNAASDSRVEEIWYAKVTSGSGAQNVTFTTVGGNGWLADYSLVAEVFNGSATASVSGTSVTSAGSTNTNGPASVTVSSGGLGAFCGIADANGSSGATPSWAGTTSSSSDIDFTWATNSFTTSVAHSTASASVTETVTGTGRGVSGWIEASFQP